MALFKTHTLSDIARPLIPSGDAAVTLGSELAASSLTGFKTDGRHTTFLLIDGGYPLVHRLFPGSTPIHIAVGTDELVAAVRHVSLVADRPTPIHMSFTQGNLEFNAG